MAAGSISVCPARINFNCMHLTIDCPAAGQIMPLFCFPYYTLPETQSTCSPTNTHTHPASILEPCSTLSFMLTKSGHQSPSLKGVDTILSIVQTVRH
jgi:hypothetical protein